MSLPPPVPGLVLRYVYLWRREYLEGRDEGSKDRPCAIVAAIREDDRGDIRAVVLPITHVKPRDMSLAVEVPGVVKRRLGLDGERSWVMLDEWNEFVWPGPDLRRLPGDNSSVAYGMLPPGLFALIQSRFLAHARVTRSKPVPRS